MSDADRWNQRYRDGKTGWDLGSAPPILERTLAEFGEGPLRVLVPGAGRAHDARAWARAGHHVTAVDFAPMAVEEAQRLAADEGVALEVELSDVLNLPSKLRGTFDLVWEQTCLCALPPEHREAYVASMHGALVPSGQLIALLWNHGKEDGPPYDMIPAEVEALFAPHFELEKREEVPETSRAVEHLFRWRRR